jgi:serine/threonine-protein kinase
MSPEQAKGKPLDKRTDIWSFGCVVYEMLTGRRAFGGDEVSETLASVLAREPDWTLLPSDLPPTVASYVRRCLHKDPRERIHDIADIRLALNGAFDSGATALPAPGRKPRTWQRAGVVALATACLGAAIGAGVMWALKPSPLVPVTRSRFALPSAQQFTHDSHQLVAISPDGTQMAYVANNRLFLRRLAELDARPVQGTESAPGPNTTTSPVFSPDGRSLAYHDGAFRRISVDGGQALTLCQGAPPHGISWSDDFIVFGQGSGGILRVPANGGPPEQIVKVEHNELASEPQMLPGNHAVLFTLASALMPVVQARWDTARVVAQALDSGKRTTIVEGGSHARYLPTGHIVYAVGGILFAVPFDPQRLVTTGAAVPVVEGVRRSASTIGSGSANYSVSSTGALIFVPGSASGAFGQREIVSVDRSGNSETLPLPQSAYVGVRLSPSGRQLVFDTDDGKEAGVWIYDLSGGSPPRKLTFGGKNRFPIWSADGRRVVFQSDRDGDLGLFWQLADGSGLAERLTSTEKGASHVAESFSPAGDQFSYSEVAPSGVSLWTFSMRDKKAARFGDSKSTAPFNSEFSPDGRWIAFTLRTSSTANIYLAAFPSGAQYQVSTTNGHHPVWLPGDEGLSFRVGANEQVAVRVTTSPSFSAGNPVTVVAGGLPIIELGTNRPYDVTRDGRRFLSVTPASAARSGPMGVQEIEIVLNWFELLGQHMQTK